MAKAKAPAFQPYVVEHAVDLGRQLCVVVAPSFHAVRALFCPIVVSGLYYGVDCVTILNAHLPDGPRPRYRASERPLQSVLAGLVTAMRERGGAPEAVVLLESLGLLNEGDIEVAKSKLENKGGAAPAEKPAKETKGKGGGKGNAEALAKAAEAREGKRAEAAKLSIKQLVKAKDSGLRGGRLAKLEFLEKEKPKTVGDIVGKTFEHEGKEITLDMGALRGMEKREHISIG